MFRVGTVGRREHIACRQALAGGWDHIWTVQIRTGEKNSFTVKGRKKLHKDGWGSPFLDPLAAPREC